MFNSYNTDQKININAVNGTIIKNYKDSFFKRFNLKSPLAEKLFCSDSDYVILQIMLCGDMEVIAELMTKRNFNKLFEKDDAD